MQACHEDSLLNAQVAEAQQLCKQLQLALEDDLKFCKHVQSVQDIRTEKQGMPF